MCVCKYLNQRIRRIGEKNEKSFKVVSKTKKKKTSEEGLSFITKFKIEFLLPFTGFRKVLGKLPANAPFLCPPENLRKPSGFLMFSGGRERVHWE